MKLKSRAFTLIELLVVIAIIGILATISVLALTNARAKSRDAKRAGDMKQIQTALELFFNDKNRYPTEQEWATGQIFSTTTAGTSTYMQFIPTAPTPADGNCTDGQNSISYSLGCGGTSYNISFCLGNTTGTLTPGPKCLTPSGILDVNCQSGCGYPLVDCRDNQSYGTVQIGDQCWMKQNLNYGTYKYAEPVPANDPDCVRIVNAMTCQGADGVQKFCSANSESSCATYGGLYEWAEAMSFPKECNVAGWTSQGGGVYTSNCGTATTYTAENIHQGICPDGWHIPNYNEWQSLSTYLGGDTVAGGKLKEAGTTHWSTPNTGGDNSSGFTALASGWRYGYYSGANTFYYTNEQARFWTTWQYAYGTCYNEALLYQLAVLSMGGNDCAHGMSIRCVKD
ncbi:MAG: FISUMP domain-containing protein [Candidatus Falkowbacteria bacterium]